MLPYPALVAAIEAAFRGDVTTPLSQHYDIEVLHGAGGAMLVMPAWRSDRYVVVKMFRIFPDNAVRGLASVQEIVTLIDAVSGQPLAMLDGQEITLRRTAAVSALAAQCLARADAAVRPIREVDVWNRTPARAEELAAALREEGVAAQAVVNADNTMRTADVITCATISPYPLIRGSLLKQGAHGDVVGAFRPDMRETDDETVLRARIFVDTREGALAEASDILLPIARGVIGEVNVLGDMIGLCKGGLAGRTSADEVTMFKSVGTAIEDWAAAVLANETNSDPET